jgi:4-hydroxy-3-methylbut-2-enyl diphosphate reductase
LVTKVHHEVRVRANQGYTVVYVGHAGHDEAIGTMAVAPTVVKLVETPEDVDALDLPKDEPVALLAQTTLSHDEWSDVRDRAVELFPALWQPGRSDLCFATTNRQAALRAIVDASSAIVVIGSENSSNTRALEKVAIASGSPRVLRVNNADELPSDLSGVIGLTAGASAPDELVEAVIARLNPAEGIEIVRVTDEDEYFPPPPELRKLVSALESTVALALGVESSSQSLLSNDRSALASTVLADLASGSSS